MYGAIRRGSEAVVGTLFLLSIRSFPISSQRITHKKQPPPTGVIYPFVVSSVIGSFTNGLDTCIVSEGCYRWLIAIKLTVYAVTLVGLGQHSRT